MLICLRTGDINLHCIIKVVAIGFLHCKVTIFPFVINTYLGGDIFRLYKYPSSPQDCHPLILASIGGPCQQLLLLWYSNNRFYFIYFFYIHYLVFFSNKELSFLPPPLIYLFIYLYNYRLMDIYFVLWVIIQSYHYFVGQIIPAFGYWDLF